MKFWLVVALILAGIYQLNVEKHKTLGPRLAYNIGEILAGNTPVALADSRQQVGVQTSLSVTRHIAYLRHTVAAQCPAGQQFLAAAATTYKSGWVDDATNQQLTQQVKKLCPST